MGRCHIRMKIMSGVYNSSSIIRIEVIILRRIFFLRPMILYVLNVFMFDIYKLTSMYMRYFSKNGYFKMSPCFVQP